MPARRLAPARRSAPVADPVTGMLLLAALVLLLAMVVFLVPGVAASPQGAEADPPPPGAPPQGAEGPRYVQRLDLPVETDRLVSPRSVTADLHTGEVFVTDLHRDRVVIFGPDGAFRYQIRGGDVFRAPRDVAVDPEGFLYLVANRGTRDVLLKLDFDGLPVGEIVPTGLTEVSGLHLPEGSDAGFVETSGLGLVGTGQDGAAQGGAGQGETGQGETGPGGASPPAGDEGEVREEGDGAGEEVEGGVLLPLRLVSLALSPEGDRLYLLDEANKRLWLATVDGRVTGSVDLTEGLAPNRARDLELGHVDVYGDRVLVAMASLGEIHLFGLDGDRRGHVGFHGTAPCQLAFPVAAARDAGGDYLVIDQQRMLILRWSPVGNRCVGEYWGLGSKPGYFYFPFDLALGPPGGGEAGGDGDLYVSQGYEGRVQAYSVEEPAALPEEEDDEGEGGGGEGDEGGDGTVATP